MPAKIVVASYTEQLKSALSRSITGTNIDIKFAFNLIGSTAHFSPNEPNVLIYDIDNSPKPSNYIRIMLEKYNLLIILTGSDPKKAYDFYAYGIKDYIIKPEDFNSSDGREFVMSISERIRMFFSSISSRPVNKPAPKQYSPQRMSMHTPLRMQSQLANSKLGHKKDCIIAIASSTGGPEALDKILRMLPEDLPPILIAQHMPSTFTKQFAQRLNNYSALTVKEAEDSEPIYPGHVYIAPGDFHMVVKKRGNELFLNCITGSKVNGVRPAADVLFESIANIMPSKSIGVILTGMGADGAKGLCMMKNVGSYNIGQDETSCVIYGMPRVAYNLGCLDVQLPLDKIPDRIVSIVNKIF